jgi:hypothetical protein
MKCYLLTAQEIIDSLEKVKLVSADQEQVLLFLLLAATSDDALVGGGNNKRQKAVLCELFGC